MLLRKELPVQLQLVFADHGLSLAIEPYYQVPVNHREKWLVLFGDLVGQQLVGR